MTTRVHVDVRAVRTPRAGRARGRRGAGRVRLRGDQRPLLPVARRDGPLAVRVERARCRHPGDRAGRADDVRDLPAHALPPGRRGPEGRHRRPPQRRPLHPRPRGRREPQRARRRAELAAGQRPSRDARGGAHRSSTRSSTAATSTSPASTTGSTPRRCGTCRRPGSRSGSRSRATQSVETFADRGRPPDRRRAGRRARAALERRQRQPAVAQDRPAPDLLGHRSRRQHRPRPRAVPLVRRRLEGERRAARPGRLRRCLAVRHQETTSPTRSRAGPTSSAIVKAVRAFEDAGFTDVALVQIGDESQHDFLQVAEQELLPPCGPELSLVCWWER